MARQRAHLSQRALAERIGCRQATIARWERGDRLASYDDVRRAVSACGLALDVRLTHEDRSWWPQIAEQLSLSFAQRIRRLVPAGGDGIVSVLGALSVARVRAVIIGEVAGALQGWPLVLGGETVEVCARANEGALSSALEVLDVQEMASGVYRCPDGLRVIVNDVPPGTSGYGDLVRGAELIDLEGADLQTGGLLDLLRIADASQDSDARRHALALRTVLDVKRSQEEFRWEDDLSSGERIGRWINRQTPVA